MADVIKEYKVALVVARAGLVDGQLQEVRKRIKEKAQFTESMIIVVPGYAVLDPEGTICQAVRNLKIMSKVTMEYLAFDPHAGRAAERLVDLFKRVNVDEVWCCTTPAGATRPNKVQRHGMKLFGGRGYNPVPYWVSLEGPAIKKEQKAWPINCG